MRKSFVSISIILLAFWGVYSQTSPPTKKRNNRPVVKEVKKPVDPFETADVKKMAEQCVTLETEAGKIELEFYPEQAPETVRNFLNLAATGFYDTTNFSRVVPNFVIQGGSFSTRQTKPESMYEKANRNLKDEPNLIKHDVGILSMARGDEPNSASTHFFILVREASFLDGKFAAFGKVTKGMEVVEAINKMAVDGEKPVKPVQLIKAIVAPCPAKPEQ